MHARPLAALTALFATLIGATPAPAGGPADGTLSRAIVYRVGPDAGYAEGCIGGDPPCLCPIQLGANLRGTFLLRQTPGPDHFTQRYLVQDVNLLANLGNNERRIVGHGTYEVSSPSPLTVAQSRMQLTLRIGDADSIEYDSGWSPIFGPIGTINLPLEPVGNPCFGALITLQAAPVPARELIGYALGDDSTFIEGCYEPCRCAIRFAPIAGGFALVPLPAPGAPAIHQEWALVRIGMRSLNDTPATDAFITARGSGIYQINIASAAPVPPHRLILDLAINRDALTDQPIHFDSGWMFQTQGIGTTPPRIDIDAARNGFYCLDQVFSIDARPVNAAPSPLLSYAGVAEADTLAIRPDLPAGWDALELPALPLDDARVDLLVETMGDHNRHTLTNTTGEPLNIDTVVKVTPGMGVCDALVDGAPAPFERLYDESNVLVGARVTAALSLDPDAPTVIDLITRPSADVNHDAVLNDQDFFDFVNLFFNATDGDADLNADGFENDQDFFDFVNAFFDACS